MTVTLLLVHHLVNRPRRLGVEVGIARVLSRDGVVSHAQRRGVEDGASLLQWNLGKHGASILKSNRTCWCGTAGQTGGHRDSERDGLSEGRRIWRTSCRHYCSAGIEQNGYGIGGGLGRRQVGRAVAIEVSYNY